jgi:hypothetical protein
MQHEQDRDIRVVPGQRIRVSATRMVKILIGILAGRSRRAAVVLQQAAQPLLTVTAP